ncbi:hypothetical protein EV426DRAFT_596057 [Tirmania nivea]|nr:hypothetical protein EV426DRAFT_596057 [Tirmania nivea]
MGISWDTFYRTLYYLSIQSILSLIRGGIDFVNVFFSCVFFFSFLLGTFVYAIDALPFLFCKLFFFFFFFFFFDLVVWYWCIIRFSSRECLCLGD